VAVNESILIDEFTAHLSPLGDLYDLMAGMRVFGRQAEHSLSRNQIWVRTIGNGTEYVQAYAPDRIFGNRLRVQYRTLTCVGILDTNGILFMDTTMRTPCGDMDSTN